jgi:hypothetical protein
MSNTNYTQNNEFILHLKKINIIDYVLNNSQEIRLSHIDLSNPCLKAVYERNHNKNNEEMSTCHQMRIATKNTKQYLNLVGKTSSKIYTCHFCINDSTHPNGFVCTEPTHLYFGTKSENEFDKHKNKIKNEKLEPISRHEASKKSAQSKREKNEEAYLQIMSDMGKIATSKDNHPNNINIVCSWCNVESNLGNFKRWHGNNCKKNPSSHRFKV